jgi:hypothetical protein
MSPPRLLHVLELGGYPNLVPLYQRLGFDARVVESQRKARTALKQQLPDVVVAEYNFQSDFRDRSSNLESLMAILQRHRDTRILVFYLPEHQERFERFHGRFPWVHPLPYPITEDKVAAALTNLTPRDKLS